jgi:hypothetical protein
MSLQDKNKRGVSVMIGYILLVTVAVVMGGIVYAWLKSYAPTETINCEDGVSISISDFTYDCQNSLNVTIRNTGRFSLTGYFIRASNSSEQELATIDLAPYLNQSFGGYKLNTWVKFHETGENTLLPEHQIKNTFQLDGRFGKLYSIEIMAARYQTEDNKKRFVICSDSITRQEFNC